MKKQNHLFKYFKNVWLIWQRPALWWKENWWSTGEQLPLQVNDKTGRCCLPPFSGKPDGWRSLCSVGQEHGSSVVSSPVNSKQRKKTKLSLKVTSPKSSHTPIWFFWLMVKVTVKNISFIRWKPSLWSQETRLQNQQPFTYHLLANVIMYDRRGSQHNWTWTHNPQWWKD